MVFVGLSIPSLVSATTPTGTYFDHIVIIAMENSPFQYVLGDGTGDSNTTFLSSMLPYSATEVYRQGYGADGRLINGCSAACYVSFTTGSTYGISDNYCNSLTGCSSSPTWNVPDIVTHLTGFGLTWQAYCEAKSGTPCPRYANHFPFLAFSNTYNSANTHISTTVSTSDFITAANATTPSNFLWYTPNDCNNMHDPASSCGFSPQTPIQHGDSYLKSFLVGSTGSITNPTGGLLKTNLFTNAAYRTLLVLWWDECNSEGNDSPSDALCFSGGTYNGIAYPSGDTPILFYERSASKNLYDGYAPYYTYFVKTGAIDTSTHFDHYSTLHMIENNWQLSCLVTAQ